MLHFFTIRFNGFDSCFCTIVGEISYFWWRGVNKLEIKSEKLKNPYFDREGAGAII